MAREHEGSGMPREWLEQGIVELQRELAQAREEIERLSAAINSKLDLMQQDEQWKDQARALLEEAWQVISVEWALPIRGLRPMKRWQN